MLFASPIEAGNITTCFTFHLEKKESLQCFQIEVSYFLQIFPPLKNTQAIITTASKMLRNKWHTGYTASPTKSSFQTVSVFQGFYLWIPNHWPTVWLPLSRDDIQSKNKSHPTNKWIHKDIFFHKGKKRELIFIFIVYKRIFHLYFGSTMTHISRSSWRSYLV